MNDSFTHGLNHKENDDTQNFDVGIGEPGSFLSLGEIQTIGFPKDVTYVFEDDPQESLTLPDDWPKIDVLRSPPHVRHQT